MLACLVFVIGCGAASSTAPSAPAAAEAIVLAGQSNAVNVEPFLKPLLPNVVTVARGGIPITDFAIDGPLWPTLEAALRQPVRAFVWFQGEYEGQALHGVDVGDPVTPGAYIDKLRELIARVRRTAGNAHLPVIICGLAHHVYLDEIRTQQLAYVQSDPDATFIRSDDLLPFDPGEIHLSPAGYQQMAARIVAALR